MDKTISMHKTSVIDINYRVKRQIPSNKRQELMAECSLFSAFFITFSSVPADILCISRRILFLSCAGLHNLFLYCISSKNLQSHFHALTWSMLRLFQIGRCLPGVGRLPRFLLLRNFSNTIYSTIFTLSCQGWMIIIIYSRYETQQFERVGLARSVP